MYQSTLLEELKSHAVGTGLRAVTWNPYGGGVDDDGSGRRLRAQAGILARLAPDVLALQECTHLPVVLDTDAKESS